MCSYNDICQEVKIHICKIHYGQLLAGSIGKAYSPGISHNESKRMKDEKQKLIMLEIQCAYETNGSIEISADKTGAAMDIIAVLLNFAIDKSTDI